MIKKLPDVCKDCAEFGSHFCEECMEEMMNDVAPEDRVTFSKVLRQLAKKDIDNSSKS
jgi:hypothetical protein